VKDKLFRKSTYPEGFQFDSHVSQVFDDMVNRSVPYYQDILVNQVEIIKKYTGNKLAIVDLGCSTGSHLINIAMQLKDRNLTLTGIDNSSSMLDKAREKHGQYLGLQEVNWIESDLLQTDFPSADIFLCNFTLQFVKPVERRSLLSKIYHHLNPNGLLLLSEKIALPAEISLWEEFYFDYKRNNGYSELEISRKREALENVLIPWTDEQNRFEISKVGFYVENYFKWFNWSCYFCQKK